MKKKFAYSIKLATVGLSLLLLPGCGSGHEDAACSSCVSSENHAHHEQSATPVQTDDVWMIRLDGQNVLGKKEFDETLAAMLAPQFRGALTPDMLPAQVKMQYLTQLGKLKALCAHALHGGIAERKEFIEQFDKALRLIKEQLLVQFLRKDVYDRQLASAKEIEAYFKDHQKDYVKEVGGIDLHAVKFSATDEGEEQADSFVSAVRGNEANFDELARTAPGGTLREFGRVAEDAPQVPEALRTELHAIKSFPSVGMVKDGNDIWVYYAADKKDPVYMSFDEVKQHVEEMVKQNKWQQEMTALEDKVVKDLGMQINEEYFKKEDEQKNQATAAATAQHKGASVAQRAQLAA